MEFLSAYGEATKTAFGFFWKSGWAFVFGYFISAMIQAFVPKGRLTRHMGKEGPESVGLATAFGAISSSCSFAALAAARALFAKGAHFVATVAFMFASTNLVIELGILIVIFLGWQFLVAELIGGLVLISISWLLIHWTAPREWIDAAREKAEADAEVADDFDPEQRIRSRAGWRLVGRRFVGEWKMVWEDILIGFTIAGFVAVLVPDSFWAALFLTDAGPSVPGWLVAVENALVAPFAAAATFIGSMGNIPLATVLNANGVLFAGIMGFIYSDLMVPPLVRVNSKYYGWKVALYIAGVMYASIVATALLLHAGFSLLGFVPESRKVVEEVTRLQVDYTFYLNLAAVALAAWLVWLNRRYRREDMEGEMEGMGSGGLGLKQGIAFTVVAVLLGGFAALAFAG